MIDYNTILSTTEGKLTLLQWLKKVETALKDASATSFKVNKKGEATISFSIVFADGSELESGEIVLQQGESVQSAAIVNGHLILTLTNGDELDAGDLGGVTSFSIDASQHLIVHYQNGTAQDLGAIFTGNVNIAGNFTADSIVENMTGYVFTKAAATANITTEYIYCGIVKTGNKLSFVVAANITRTGEVDNGYIDFGYFVCPAEVMNKIYPVNIGGADFIDLKETLLNEGLGSIKHCNCYAQKGLNTISCIAWVADPNNTLVLDQKYYVRYECTLLLSEDLAA